MTGMENFASLVPLVVFIPLLGMLLNMFLGKNLGEKLVGFIAVAASGLAFCVALIMAVAMWKYGYQAVVINPPLIHSWISIPAAGIDIPWQFRVDTLSLTMMLVVTGVGTLIHIYSIGYMHGDSRFPRFFMYLNLFLAFMLVLVTGNNYLMTFVGWEGVGLCSFLLIGFWFDKTRGEGWKNSNAARKAFIVTRIGDCGFLIAAFLMFWTFGTLDYYKPGELPAAGDQVAALEAPSGTVQGTTPAATANNGTTSGTVQGQVTAQAAPAQKGVFGQTADWLAQGNHIVHVGPYSLPFTTVLTLITLFMLLGVTGKSAQIPLFVWLPDAMAGPTPVSALIHAATMVTAGIFLVTRSNVLYSNAPFSAAMVTLVGAVTAVMAGFVAMGQWDIKKVLAYSTVSQLGFMVAAVGLGGYSAGMFHLVTHAFFKALLFLGAGSIIHGVEHGYHLAHGHHGEADEAHDAHAEHEEHGEHVAEEEEAPFDAQDMRNMGGLRKRMPITFWTYLIGTLALSGIFPFAGFWSKDEIIGRAWSQGVEGGRIEGYIAFGLLLIAAGFTAFYMWRQICLVFLGEPRSDGARNAPESVSLMTFPLVVLAILAVFGGLLNLPEAFSGLHLPTEGLTRWLEHSVTYATSQPFNVILALLALAIAVGGIVVANHLYGTHPLTKKGHDQLERRPETRELFRLANAKLFWDETYGRLIEQPYNRSSQWLANTLDWNFWHDYVHNKLIRDSFNSLSQFLANPVDRGAIDAGFMSLGSGAEWIGGKLKRLQTGYVRTYAFTVLVGVLFVLFLILFPLIRQMLHQ